MDETSGIILLYVSRQKSCFFRYTRFSIMQKHHAVIVDKDDCTGELKTIHSEDARLLLREECLI